ncbi:MAG: hypothetical protein ACD_3C00105G0001, partial [uncultured bacterium (gcode 4)]
GANKKEGEANESQNWIWLNFNTSFRFYLKVKFYIITK